MIERYTRPEMARVWSDENKLDTWLRVEIAGLRGLDARRRRSQPRIWRRLREATL